ncbi:hypothetical protein LUZ60_004593 [Juncus effusus]|nr:hypothetical protein LUZ60_004593 [Juncus effusus]
MNSQIKTISPSSMAPATTSPPPPASPRRILLLAVLSRLLLLTLIFIWRLLFRPYDTSASLNPPCLSSSLKIDYLNQSRPSDQILLPRVASAIESSVVWDGVYFVRITVCGYEYEQSFAFLPLLPAGMKILSRSVLAPLVPLIGYRAVLGLSGYVLNNLAFVFAALYLYRLSNLVLKDSLVAYRASVLFCFNPASIFYSSLYSESLYALFSLGGLYHLFSGSKFISVIMLALSGSARSNGTLNAGYVCFLALVQAFNALFHNKAPFLAVGALFVGFLSSVFIFAPFLAFQAFGYLNFCMDEIKMRPWCLKKLPLIYGFIQNHYWGVGFMKYFQIKQLPNFLLASPVLSLSIFTIIHYWKILFPILKSKSLLEQSLSYHELKSKERKTNLDSKGDNTVRRRKLQKIEKNSESSRDIIKPIKQNINQINPKETSIVILPFILHLAFMTFTAFFIMHVQVATRFLSASPPIYWFASHLMTTSKRWSYIMLVYFVAYILLGTLLFSNFYPFT